MFKIRHLCSQGGLETHSPKMLRNVVKPKILEIVCKMNMRKL
jgi:hypothetical protein